MAPIKEFSSADLNTISRLSGVSNVLVKVNGATVAASSFSGLLDTYTGAAAAYSTRRLNSQYTGAAMRVREDSGDTETDIGFDANGNLLTAAIATHCGIANGYVTKWYDQAASGGTGSGTDAEQSTNASQPKIYNGSAVITENGKPAIYFTKDEQLASSLGSLQTVTCDIVSVSQRVSGTGYSLFWYESSFQATQYYSTSYYMGWLRGTVGPTSDTNQHLDYHIATNGAGTIRRDSTAYTTGTLSTTRYFSGNFAFSGRPGYPGSYNAPSIHHQEFIQWNSNKSASDVSGIETDINNYYQIGNFGTPTSGLLSTYTGAAAAYSVRQLANTAALCMRVRRDNDDAEQDFGFDANGDLDTAAIATFVGSGNNGYVSKWYDQSGNGNDAEQNTGGSQPQIYNGSAVNTVNGKPIVGEVNVKRGQFLTPVDFSGDFTTFQVGKRTQPNHISFMFGSSPYWPYAGAGSSDSRVGSYTTTPVFYGDGSSMGTTREDVYNLWVNQCLFVTQGALTANNLKIGFNGTSFSMPSMQELIIWTSDQSSNRSGIETDINNYFSIY